MATPNGHTDVTSDAWSAGIALTADTVFMCVSGSIFVTSKSTPDPIDGFQLDAGKAYEFSSGQTVKYRNARFNGSKMNYEER